MYREQNRRFAQTLNVAPDVFEQPSVVLQLPPGQERRPEAVSAFALAANLLARLFLRVHLVAPNAPLGLHPWHLANLHDIGIPLAGISEGSVCWDKPRQPDIVLGIGAPPTITARRTSFVSFAGWRAGLEQIIDDSESGIFGALFASCYGAAQVFLHAVAAAGGHLRPLKPFQLSLLDYQYSATNAPTPNHVSINEVHLVGVGAVGSALIYGMGHMEALQGKMHLIDNDAVDGTNLQRYILMRREDVEHDKTDVAAAALAATGVEAIPHPTGFKQFADEHGYHFDLLITPVDSEAGRRHLAKYLPRRVLNAATGQSTVTVSRHGFGDGKACLHCLYFQPPEVITTEQRLAMDLGLAVAEVVDLLTENRGIDASVVRRIETYRRVEEGRFQHLVGLHVQSFYQRAVCGEASVPTANGTLSSPLSFISATAGVLLAAELVKSSTPALHPFVLDNYFRLDTLCVPNPAFRECRGQHVTGQCVCSDPDYVSSYKEKYRIQTR